MIEKELVPEADFKNHVSQDPKIVHQIWALAMKYIQRYVPLAAHQALTLTNDGAWHDLDLSAYISATAKRVKIAVYVTEGASADRWFILETRKHGSAMDYENIWATENLDTTTGYCTIQKYAFTFEQECDDAGVIQYLLSSDMTTANIDLVGYYETLA